MYRFGLKSDHLREGTKHREERSQSERVIHIIRAGERKDLRGADEMPTSRNIRYDISDFCH